METLIKNKIKKYTENSADYLYDAVNEAEKKIRWFVDFNEYQFNKPFVFPRVEVKKEIAKLTLNKRKKLKRAINNFHKRQSIASANRFLHFLYKEVLKTDVRVRITYGEKELKIKEMRKKYVEVRKIMLETYKEYKKEKGNFYKLRMAKGQKC